MANFTISQSVLYSGGDKLAGETYDPPTFITNTFDDDQFLDSDEILIDVNGSLVIVGSFIGTTIVSGSLFVVIDAGDGDYILFGPATPDYADFPDNFADLTIDGSPFTVCFLAGTRIATPAGETPVEALLVGDLVLAADGRTAPVKWVGIQTVVTLFADPLRSFPVRITAGALGPNLPVRDLFVSPDHALFLDGVLVHAGALVNGTTIVREAAMPERFIYFHVELDDHALILAEGVPAETFLDTVTRRRFDNVADYEALYGDIGPVLAELPAPRIKSARQLPQALRQRLAARAHGRGGSAETVAAA